jgi:hypothetical protein
MPKRSRTGKPDVNQMAKAMIDHLDKPAKTKKNPAAVALGRLGGLKGGKARAKKLTDAQKSNIARIAALARWKTNEST